MGIIKIISIIVRWSVVKKHRLGPQNDPRSLGTVEVMVEGF
jgi:hypothetical protein